MNHCNHGYLSSSFCSQCRETIRELTRKSIQEGRTIYAVLPWRGDGKYSIESAVKTYKSRSHAEKIAEILNIRDGSQLVVREVFTRSEVTA